MNRVWIVCAGSLTLAVGAPTGAGAACNLASLKGAWNYTSPAGSGGGGSAVCIIDVSETGDVNGKRCFSGSRSRRDLGKPFGKMKISATCDVSGEVGLTYGAKITYFQMTGKMDASGRKITGTGVTKGKNHTYAFTMKK